MKKFWQRLSDYKLSLLLFSLAAMVCATLLVYHLGSLVPLSSSEHQTSQAIYGWAGIKHNPLFLPLVIVRSVLFYLAPHHGAIVSRLPNVLFAALTLICFGSLLKLWHGTRTALFGVVLFGCSAWLLHSARTVSFDVLYLLAIPLLLLLQIVLQRHFKRAVIWYASVIIWGILLYIPGFVWLLAVHFFWQRRAIIEGWNYWHQWWQRALYGLAAIIWLPLLIVDLTHAGQLRLWIGLPAHFASFSHYLKQFGGVFVHLFIRGPEYPTIWLGRAPLLDSFTLVVCLIGLYFYLRHLKATRSKVVLSYAVIGVILASLGGPVGLSLLVPLAYIFAATGMAYLLHDWLHVFPLNPLARSFGIAAIALAIAVSATYNIRSYFVAWPHNPSTEAAFHSGH